jgi:hypothetical protein
LYLNITFYQFFFLKIQSNEANQYFVTYASFDNVAQNKRSQEMDESEEKVLKHAKAQNNFRRRLLNSCQIEFSNSTNVQFSTFAFLFY